MTSRSRSSGQTAPLLGLALIASPAFIVAGIIPASAFAATPEAIVRPVVSPASPHLGVVVTTTKGEWTGSPTSYSYKWLRCNAGGGECGAISGATSTTYTTVEADLGHTLVSEVTATNSEGKGSSKSNPTSTVAIPLRYWYACKNFGEGKGLYEDPACSKEGGKTKAFNWSKPSTPTSLAMKNTGNFIVKWTLAGIQFQFGCTSLAGEGTFENPTGKEATVSMPGITLTGCTFESPKESGCKLKGNQFNVSALNGAAYEFEGKPAVKFTPTGSIATFTIEGCKGALEAFNGKVTIFSGTFIGVMNSATSSLEFTKASTSGLTAGGQPVSFEGTIKVETTAGEALKLAS